MLDNYQDLIDELLGTPAVARSAAGLGERARVLIAVMRARDRLVLERLQRIKQQNDPHLKPLPSEEELRLAADPAEDAEALVSSFENARGDLVSLLMNLTLRDWERTATTDDENMGIVTLADEVERHVEFDESQRAALSQLTG
jgi:hypothetical protein